MASGGSYIAKLRKKKFRNWEYKRNNREKNKEMRGKIKEMFKIME